MTRNSVLIAAAGLLAAANVFVSPAMASNPASFIAGLDDQLQLVVHTVPIEQRPGKFRQLFRDDFDVPIIARFVFGRYWQTATPAQRQELLRVFEDYLISAYSDRLSEYADRGQPPVVTGSRAVEDGALVRSEVALGRNPTQGGRGASLAPIRVDWHVIETDGGYKIVDVVIDGVSMAATERVEFADAIQRSGGELPAVVAMLRQRIASAAR